MQFLWLIFLLVTDSRCVLFLTHLLFYPLVHSVCVIPSFCWKYCKQIKRKETPSHINFWAAWWATLPWKYFGIDFSLLCQLYQAEILLKCCSWRCPPRSDDMEVKKLVTIFLSSRLSSQGQFCSTNVLADDSEVWPWLWHVTCTLETIFSTKKKKGMKVVCTVTCQENDHRRHRLRAGFPPLPLLLLLRPVHQGGSR